MRIPRFAVLALAFAGACAEANAPVGLDGHTQVLLTDDPFPFDRIAHVNVFVQEIAASTTLDTSNGNSPSWTVVAQPSRVFDLLSLQGGATALAGEVDLPAGQYRAVRLVINTSLSSVLDTSGAAVPVHWPVAGELALYAYVEEALAVPTDGARIVIDFDVGRTFLPDGAGGFFFSPWIRAVNASATGRITGTVAGPGIEGGLFPLPNITVLAYTTGPGIAGAIVGTARTDPQGRYVIGYLRPGTYGVVPEAPANYALHSGATFVEVPAGGSVNADLAMSRDSGGGSPDTTHTTPGGPVASVGIRIGTPTASTDVAVGDSVPLTADLRDAQNAVLLGRVVSWSVSDSSVLLLQGVFGQYAIVRASQVGTATVTATSEGKSAHVTFTVHVGTGGGGTPAAVATVTLSPAAVTAAVGDSVGMYARLADSLGYVLEGRAIAWTSSDSTVVGFRGVYGPSVLLAPKKVGTATITAASEGKVGTATVTVH